jgi:two-component system OmpR family sensor kinase
LPAGLSLQLRLTLLFAGFMVLVLIFVAVLVYGLTRRSLIETVEAQADQAYVDVLKAIQENRSMSPPSRNGWVQSLPSDALLYVNIYLRELGGPLASAPVAAFERVPNLSTVAVSDGSSVVRLLGEDNFRTLQTGARLVTQVTSDDGTIWVVRAGQDVFSLTSATSLGSIDVPTLVAVAMPVRSDTMTQLRTNLIQTILVALLVFPLGVWLLAQRALTPLKRMTRAASRISSQDLSQRVPVPKSRDEVGELSLTLNRMLDRLQESFETQRRFTADASHELRTPVTAISGHASYLLRRTQPTAEQIEPLAIIRSEAQRMSKLVNDLLELARADAGLTVRREPMNLVETIEAVAKELAPVAGSAQLRAFSPQPLLEVLGDASRLKQVVLNLVQNALNAGSSEVSVSLLGEGDRARLEVLDNGPGIPEAAIPNLFERFYRVDGARSTRGNGSGLGLAIVKWIVEQHDGTVSVESKVGEGTVFTVLLPVREPSSPPPGAAKAASRPHP